MKLIQRLICKAYNNNCHPKIKFIRVFSSKVRYKHKVEESNYSVSEIPAAKGLPVVGTLFSLLKAGGSANLHLYINERHKELGPIFKESIGPVNAIFISDPQIMRKIYSNEGKYPVHILPEAWILYNKKYGSKRGLYFMDGEEWLRYRRIMNKVFLSNYQNHGFERAQTDVIDQWINGWKQLINKSIEVPEAQFYKLSLSYVVASLLGSSYLENKNNFISSIENLSIYMHSIFEESCKLNLIPAKLAAFLNLQPWKRFTVAVDSALSEGDKMVKDMIELSNDDGLLKKLIDENVPEDILKRIIVDLILAAGDTTAFTTQWAIYLLSRHNGIQQLLNSNPNDSLLLKGIVKETLRLYPAAPFITRILPEDIFLQGYRISAGELLVMSLYSSGRDERYFPQPDKFWPQRWERAPNEGKNYYTSDKNAMKLNKTDGSSNDHKGVIEPIASQPFAMGLRSCVGRKLAESQMMLTLSKIAENFHMESLRETEMTLHFVPVPKTPICIRLTPVEK